MLSPCGGTILSSAWHSVQRSRQAKHFGNTVYLFTPLYIANYCENYCVYCGFNCYNDIHRKKLTFEEIEHEMKVIADSGIEEILMLTGESRAQSDVEYIGEAAGWQRNISAISVWKFIRSTAMNTGICTNAALIT